MPRREGESGITVSGHSSVRNDGALTVEFGPMALEMAQFVAANFSLAFDKENQIHRQRFTWARRSPARCAP